MKRSTRRQSAKGASRQATPVVRGILGFLEIAGWFVTVPVSIHVHALWRALPRRHPHARRTGRRSSSGRFEGWRGANFPTNSSTTAATMSRHPPSPTATLPLGAGITGSRRRLFVAAVEQRATARRTSSIRAGSPSAGWTTACATARIPRSSRPGAPVTTAIPRSRGARLIASRSISDPPRERNPLRAWCRERTREPRAGWPRPQSPQPPGRANRRPRPRR